MNYEKTTNGIMYTENIVSVNGAAFVLYPDDNHTQAMIAEAKSELKYNRDVVSIRVANEDDRDDMYRTEIFNHPATRPLRWYQINADDKEIIRTERLKGTSIDEYVSRFVLPFTAETEAKNADRFGNSIYDR